MLNPIWFEWFARFYLILFFFQGIDLTVFIISHLVYQELFRSLGGVMCCSHPGSLAIQFRPLLLQVNSGRCSLLEYEFITGVVQVSCMVVNDPYNFFFFRKTICMGISCKLSSIGSCKIKLGEPPLAKYVRQYILLKVHIYKYLFFVHAN